MGKAMKSEPENPRVYLLAGINAKFTPKMFGGGESKARQFLKKATELFPKYKSPSPLYPDWGYREVYAWLGIIAVDTDTLKLAKIYFEKALEIDPDFSWVKFQLLPALEKSMKETKE